MLGKLSVKSLTAGLVKGIARLISGIPTGKRRFDLRAGFACLACVKSLRPPLLLALALTIVTVLLFNAGFREDDIPDPVLSNNEASPQTADVYPVIETRTVDEIPDDQESPPIPHAGSYLLVSGVNQFIKWDDRTPASKRTEIVTINEELLAAVPVLEKGDTLQFEFSGKAPISVEVTSVKVRPNGTVAIDGRTQPEGRGRMHFSYTDGVAAILIDDTVNSATYKVEFNREHQAYIAMEIDYERSDILGCSTCQCEGCAGHAAEIENGDAVEPEPELDLVAEDSALPDVVTLDVLAVYTPAARINEGGETGILNNISLAFQKANDTHQNSDTRVILNLVHTEEVVYAEDDPETSSSPSTYLDDVTDGNILGVHDLRDTHEADFVVFFVKTEKTGGRAWRPTSYNRPELAYSIVRVQQTDFTFTMVHEVGHNMGLGHSATQSSQPYTGGFYSYAAGWQWADSSSSASIGFCSVMTYEDFDGVSGKEYNRVAHFSNPDISYNGVPTGDAVSGNAALVVRNGRFEYSGFRGAKAVPAGYFSGFPEFVGFEDYLGIWYQPDTEEADWERRSGSTPTSSTGPGSAFEEDNYLYLEASDFIPGDEAVLLTAVDFSGLVDASLEFSYHMFGSAMGSLALEVSTDGGNNWTLLWTRSGDQGNSWISETIDLSLYDGQLIKLRFRAVRGSSFRSDISLDAITIDADTPPPGFAGWLALNYPALSDSSQDGDPDFDGLSNFMEYALGRQLDQADGGGAITAVHDKLGNTLDVSFKREQFTVRYVVESSDILDDWSLATIEWDSDLLPANLVPVGDIQTVAVRLPTGDGILFLRLRLTE